MTRDRALLTALLLGTAFALRSPACVSAAQGEIRLEAASAAEIARQLQSVVGAPVRLRGGTSRQLSLVLAPGPPARTLDQVTAALGGSWRLRLHVQRGRPSLPTASPELEQKVAVGFQDVPASRAFAVVARDLKAELELKDDLQAPVSLIAAGVPARVVLDRIAERAGATWTLSYTIELPDQAPESAAPAPAPHANPPVVTGDLEVYVPATPTPARPAERPRASPQPPTGVGLSTSLWDGLNYVIRIGPDQRAAAVKDFVEFGSELFSRLSRLPAAERAVRIRAAAPVLAQWRRLYAGLAPEVARELAPVTRFLERHLAAR